MNICTQINHAYKYELFFWYRIVNPQVRDYLQVNIEASTWSESHSIVLTSTYQVQIQIIQGRDLEHSDDRKALLKRRIYHEAYWLNMLRENI
jgi:hypothetical protein